MTTKTIGNKMFSSYQATRRYIAYTEVIAPKDQEKFSEAIRAMFDKKITSEETLNDYYLTEKDIDGVYDRMFPSNGKK